MTNKNKKLLIILAVQVIVVSILAFTGGNNTKLDFETDIFTVADTADITKIELSHEANLVTLSKINNSWYVNEKEEADRSLMLFLKSILKRVEVKRPISQKDKDKVFESLKDDGAKVVVYNGSDKVLTFYAGGNEGKTKSYFATNEKPYIVNVSGYQDYLSGIFKLKAHQWKDRLIASSSWRSISEIKVNAQNDEGFRVYFTGQDLAVEDVNPLDTGKMMNYVGQFSAFMINEFVLPGQFEKYDSLANTDPMATLTLTDIDAGKNLELKVFHRFPDEGYHLIVDQKGRMMMVDMRRVSGIVPPKKFFEKQERPKPIF